jgi:predicted esterase
MTAGDDDAHVRGRLSYRPGGTAGAKEHDRRGSFDLEAGAGRPAALHVPDVPGPLRLVVVLHGAGGNPRRTRELLLPYAEHHRLLLLAPASRSSSWDVIHGGFGADVATIDELLRRVTADFVVDGLTVAGFSDGASYALTLGVSNGDVFDSVVAFSPGFAAAQVRHGTPRVFVSHGTADRVLPIDRCSRRLVPALEHQGYDVTYEEFDGGHEVPPEIRQQAVDWLG